MTARIQTSVLELRNELDEVRAGGRRVGVVPTMGALHEGHLSLIREAARRAEEVVVTIFVNPTQFGPNEDFERYPRDLENDTKRAESAGATIIFAPPVAEMYPSGEQTRVRVVGLSRGLCGESRPGHFEGVATVVAKLFNAVGPGCYIFGQKDFQQWRLIEQMARDLLFPVEIVGMPIVREPDGMALSSRNAYLKPGERLRALTLARSLQHAIEAYRSGVRDSGRLVDGVSAELAKDVRVDYVEIRDPSSLDPIVGEFSGPVLLAVAGYVGSTRLIDNVVLCSTVADILPGGAQ